MGLLIKTHNFRGFVPLQKEEDMDRRPRQRIWDGEEYESDEDEDEKPRPRSLYSGGHPIANAHQRYLFL